MNLVSLYREFARKYVANHSRELARFVRLNRPPNV